MSITFPVSIGLSGAPDSGKQKVIEEFVKLAEPYFAENGSQLLAIANPGTVIEETYNQAMGPFGSYVEDLWTFFARYQAEAAVQRTGASYITSGTVLDSIAHTGVNMERIMAGIVTPQTEIILNKYKVTMTQLSLLFADRFAYTFGFYIPYKPKVILANEDEFTNHFNQRIDQAIQMVFANFNLRIQILDEPSYEEKAQAILNTVKDVIENGPKPGSSAAVAETLLESKQDADGDDPIFAAESPTPEADTLAA